SDSRRGLGLGLALCKSIVVAHGGEIFVRDHLPRGVEFCFTLPSEEVPIHE
ncbi:MAG: ATP-binding protein, partial [Oscillospiraceae bacterium]